MQLNDPATSARASRRVGQKELERGHWEEARTQFERAIKIEDTAEGQEGLATAAYFLEDVDAVFAARERAFALHDQRGDRAAAAAVAVQIVTDVMDYRPDSVVADGWLGRAARLLEDHEPVREHAILAVLRGHQALMADHDIARARTLAAEALGIARNTRAKDVEMLALALDGLAAVSSGDVAQGMALLAEATATATSGEVRDIHMAASACCYLIHACDRVRDFPRAAEWCERVTAFCRRWRFASMFTICRTQYASVLMAQGNWDQAEAELLAALGDFEALRPALAGSASTRLALLRVRQDRLEEAAALLAKAPAHRLEPLVQAELSLARGEAASARDHAARYLARVGETDRTERIAGLEILTLAAARAGDAKTAAEAARELKETADRVGTDALHGAALAAAGELEEDTAKASKLLRSAVDAFDRAGMSWHAARCRCSLATVMAHEGTTGQARNEATLAAAVFELLGAASDLVIARRLAGDPTRMIAAPPAVPAKPASPSPLSSREVEVLRAVASGAGDREVAERLFLSPHTVHRHVANILLKLEVPTRAAAVAAASKLGLLA